MAMRFEKLAIHYLGVLDRWLWLAGLLDFPPRQYRSHALGRSEGSSRLVLSGVLRTTLAGKSLSLQESRRSPPTNAIAPNRLNRQQVRL